MPLSKEDLEKRRNFVGASEVAAVAGEDPYRKPLDVWLSKKGMLEQTTNDAMELGNVIERPVLEWYAEKRGLTLTYPSTQIHPAYPFLGATPDAIIPADDTGIQVKFVGVGMLRHWADEDAPPPWVQIQVQSEMEVVRVRRTIVLALLGGPKPREYIVERDPDFGAAIVELTRRFWIEFVEADECPPVDESEAARRYLESKYPRATRGFQAPPPPGMVELVRAYENARRTEALAKKAKELAGNQLRDLVADAEGYATQDWKVTWSNGHSSVSWKAIAEALKPSKELVEFHTSHGERTLRVHIKGDKS
jgi:putative phage-type endonuclease